MSQNDRPLDAEVAPTVTSKGRRDAPRCSRPKPESALSKSASVAPTEGRIHRTLVVSRARKRERSARCKASAAHPGSAWHSHGIGILSSPSYVLLMPLKPVEEPRLLHEHDRIAYPYCARSANGCPRPQRDRDGVERRSGESADHAQDRPAGASS